MNELICNICFHHCILREGMTGRCRARTLQNGVNTCANYGRITALAMDPIEKKPLARFYPGSWILSAGSYGCNLSCPFCQNWHISMADERTTGYTVYTPEKLAELVLGTEGNLGIAFTYNEPLIEWEYVRDTASRIRPYGKKVVLVTNGCVEETVLKETAPWVDAVNIDLKGDADFYQEIGGDYNQVRHTIEYMQACCHVEVTSLIIPGKNDSEEWIASEAQWLASLNPDIPLHITRYFPQWRYSIPATDPSLIVHLKQTAEQYLNYVYTGNI